MMAITPERAREMLGGHVNGHDVLSSRDLLAGHANRQGAILVTRSRRFWQRSYGRPLDREPRPASRPGSGLLTMALVLLVFLGAGLLAVSVAAQYRYVLAQRHQVTASAIEALALDVGLCILSCLALALARRGLASTVERVLILAVAGASAGMNFAAADAGSWRSVLAYCMPPVFLAVIVDRVASVIRRHYLEMPDVSPWRMAGRAVLVVARFCAFGVLYALRLVLDPAGTCRGVRWAILTVTPLPEAPRQRQDRPQAKRQGRARSDTKTARLLALAAERHGGLGGIPPERVSPICSELAPLVGLDIGAARTALRRAVLAALPGGGGGAR